MATKLIVNDHKWHRVIGVIGVDAALRACKEKVARGVGDKLLSVTMVSGHKSGSTTRQHFINNHTHSLVCCQTGFDRGRDATGMCNHVWVSQVDHCKVKF